MRFTALLLVTLLAASSHHAAAQARSRRFSLSALWPASTQGAAAHAKESRSHVRHHKNHRHEPTTTTDYKEEERYTGPDDKVNYEKEYEGSQSYGEEQYTKLPEQRATAYSSKDGYKSYSTAHGKGVCKPGFGTEDGKTCQMCPAGMFSVGGYRATCRFCPKGTRSNPGSTEPEQCVCKPGHGISGDDEDVSYGARVCHECTAGEYSFGGMNAECTTCPGETTNDKRGATGPDECDLCKPGYGLPGCRLCPEGTFSNKHSYCKPCDGPNETSPAGASSPSECTCAPGYGGATCLMCEPGKFSEGLSRAPCKFCQEGLVSMPGAPAESYCKCPPGEGLQDGICKTCPIGFYSPGPLMPRHRSYGSAHIASVQAAAQGLACQACPAGWLTLPGARHEDDCFCPPGTYGPNCLECLAGSYCPGGHRPRDYESEPAPIINCPNHMSSNASATSESSCYCDPGFGGQNCDVCPLGTWHAAGDRKECVKCGPGQVTMIEGAPSIDYCYCENGQAPVGGRCDQCSPGTWSDDGICRNCPANMTSSFGADSAEDCYCKPGHFGLECALCTPGAWCPGGEEAPINPCSDNRWSNAGSQTDSECFCAAGFGGTSCSLCPEGYWSLGGTTEPCSRCQPGQTSPAGAPGPEWCQCPAGEGVTPPIEVCSVCPAGTYQPGPLETVLGLAPARASDTASSACLPCPNNRTSLPGTKTSDACWCKPGTYGISCDTCEPGSYCPGGETAEMHTCSINRYSKPGAKSDAECTCVPGYGGVDCQMCPSGFFSEGGSTGPCQACGPSQTSSPGSPARSYCQCSAGNGLVHPGDTICSVCPANTYKPGPELMLDASKAGAVKMLELVSLAQCRPCPDGRVSLPGTVNSSKCYCPPGSYGDDCAQCPAGSWCPGGEGAPINTCPENRMSKAGARAPQECMCNAGFGGTSCKQCPANFFSEGGSLELCTPCGPRQLSAPGSVSQSFCFCKAGEGLAAPDATTCTVCPPNTFSLGLLSPADMRALADKQTSPVKALALSECQKCPGNRISEAGSTSKEACNCPPGTWGPECQICEAGSYCPGGHPSHLSQRSSETHTVEPPMIRCPEGMTSPPGSAEESQCVCMAGQGGLTCQPCEPGTFSVGSNRDDCEPCQPGQTSIPAAPSAAYCSCRPGQGEDCYSCPIGQWSERGVCKDCPANRTSAVGATGLEQCYCMPGFYGSECRVCTAGSFCPGGKDAPIDTCGPNRYSAPGSKSSQECQCIAGFGGADCNKCKPGTYSSGGSTLPCQQCPTTTTSPAGAPGPDFCVCPAGQGGSNGTGTCAACPPGTFSAGPAAFAAAAREAQSPVRVTPLALSVPSCERCPEGWTSKPGAISVDKCVCAPGRFGPQCLPCVEGSYCKGGDAAPIASCGPNKTSDAQATTEEECYCAAGFGGSDCAPCEYGTYSLGGDRESCTACPFGTTTTIKSATSEGFCKCPAGYGQPENGTACALCPAGSWSNPLPTDAVEAGSICEICPTGRVSPPGSTSINACVCPPGYYGLDCAICPANSFCPGAEEGSGGAAAPISTCGANKLSTLGSQSAQDCVCAPGYGGEDCQMCPSGTFSAGNTTDPCTPCGPRKSSLPGATSEADCQCVAGWGIQTSNTSRLAATTECTHCPANTFQPGPMPNRQAQLAAVGQEPVTSLSQCIACPANRMALPGSTSIQDCVCAPGTYGDNCEVCLPGFVCPGGNTAGMFSCGPNTVSGSGAQNVSQCVCVPGYGGKACQMCPSGTFSAGNTTDPCTPCGPRKSSLPGATSEADCQCVAGWGIQASTTARLSATIECTYCPANTFQPGPIPDRQARLAAFGQEPVTSLSQCIACPANRVALPGSTSIEDCVCAAGTYGDHCEICPAGSFCHGGKKELCPANAVSPPGSNSSSACVCYPGYGGENCEQCSAGTWGPGSQAPCVQCGLRQSSLPGASSPDACQCAAGWGFVQPGDTICSYCPANTFQPGPLPASRAGELRILEQQVVTNTSQCLACPTGRVALPGSTSVEDCVCEAGTYGISCEPCPPGSYCEGGKDAQATSCGNNKLSQPGAKSAAECFCVPGYGGTDCAQCDPGKFGQGMSLLPCMPCGAGLTSPPGAVNELYCGCPRGQGLMPLPVVNGTTGLLACGVCPENTFGLGVFNPQSARVSQIQPPVFFTPTVCQGCPVGRVSLAGSGSPDDCVCPPGTFGINCAPCPAGSYCPPVSSSTGGRALPVSTPIPCPANMTSPPGSAFESQCVCIAGYGGPECNLCAAGSFSEGGNRTSCQLCGPGQSSMAGATSRAACGCMPGLGGDNCQTCPRGSWSSNGVCNGCPASFTSDLGATAADQCYCPQGTYDQGELCVPCTAGFYCEGKAAPAKLCGDNRYSAPGASSSEECFCAAGYGGVDCQQCRRGTFSNGGTRATCQACPENLTSRPGAQSIAECKLVCPVGQGSDPTSPTNCSTCLPGTYSVMTGALLQSSGLAGALATEYPVCATCPAGLTSPAGAKSVKDCVCAPGRFGPDCNSCPAGYYCEGNNATAVSCGLGKTSMPNAASEADCYCSEGRGGQNCELCELGTYSAGFTRNDCTKCPGDLTTLVKGSISESACTCRPGYGIPLLRMMGTIAACSVCPLNTYSNPLPTAAVPDRTCQLCPANYTSPAGSDSINACVCSAGRFGASCNQDCLPGSWCANGQINSCPAGMTSQAGATSAADCVCTAGHGGQDCNKCGGGSYSPGIGRKACITCPAGMTSIPGAPSFEYCQCNNPGQSRDCTTCPKGTWSPGTPVSLEGCLPCPDRKTSDVGASSPDQCYCQPGYYGLDCTLCPAGSFCPGGVAAPVKSCGANRYSAPGSKTLGDCYCSAGYGGPECLKCEPGTFSAGYSTAPCSSCPAGLTSQAGAPSIEHCGCAAGYGLVPAENTTCSVCQPGTFSTGPPVTTSAAPLVLQTCQSCGPAKLSPLGAKSPSECVCAQGFYSDLCLPCPKDYYCEGGAAAPLESCGPNMMTLQAQAGSSQLCVCKPGHGGPNCEPCGLDSYSPGGSMDACLSCPTNMHTLVQASTNYTSCVCKPGFGRPPWVENSDENFNCEACPGGVFASWSAGSTRMECIPCPLFTVTKPFNGTGAKQPEECLCAAGYGSTSNSTWKMMPCDVCHAPLYSEGGADARDPWPACTVCQGSGNKAKSVAGVCLSNGDGPAAMCGDATTCAGTMF